MIGKIIADVSGLTEKLGGQKNDKFEEIKQIKCKTEIDTTEWDKFQAEVKAADGDTIKIKAIIDDSKLSDLKKIDGLLDYAVEQSKAGKDIDLDSVNEFITKQNYQNIANQAHGFNGVRKAIKEYNKAVKDTSTDTQKFIDAIGQSNSKLGAYLAGLNRADAGMGRYALSLVKTTAKTVALNLATAALNTAIYSAASLGISWLISGISTLVDRLIVTKKEIQEAAAEAKTAINDIKSSFDSLKTTTNDVKERYAELAQGVENLGKANQSRGTLSTEDYEEFLSLSNQLAELFPQLRKGVDDNDNAILSLSGSTDTIVESLNNLIAAQQRLANQEILEKMPAAWKGYTSDLIDYKSELQDAEKQAEAYHAALDKLTTDNSGKITVTNSLEQQSILAAAKKIGIDKKTLSRLYNENLDPLSGGLVSAEWDLSSLTEKQISQLTKELGALTREYENAAQLAKNKITSANAEMSAPINAWISTEGTFTQMNADMQNLVKDILLNSNWFDSLLVGTDSKTLRKGQLDTFGNWDYITNAIQQNLLYAINQIDSEETQQALSDALDDSLSAISLQKLIGQLTHEDGLTQDNPLIIYLQAKLTDTQDFENRIEKSLTDIYDKDHNRTVSSTQEKAEYEQLTEYTKEFSKEQWELWITATAGAENAAEAIQKYKEALAPDNDNNAAFTDIFSLKDADDALTTLGELNEQLNTVQTAYRNLKDAIDTYTDSGTITIDQFQTIAEQGSQFLDYLTHEDGQLGINEQAMYDLAEARITAMKAQMLQGIADNISKIKDEADAADYLASTNYDLAASYDARAEHQLNLWKTEALQNGLSTDTINNVIDKAKEDIAKINALAENIDLGSLGGSSAKSTPSDLLNAEISLLDAQLETGAITLKEYADKYQAIAEEYYKAGRINAQDYHNHIKTMLEKQKTTYEKALSAITRRLDKEITTIQDAINTIEDQNDALETQKTQMENAAEAAADYYDTLINAENDTIDHINAENDALQERLNKYDALTSTADHLYEAEQNNLKAQQDVIQEKIDALNEQNDAIDHQYRKEQALYELERSRRQRTKLVYTHENGFVYRTDDAAISEAKKNAEDIKTEELVSSLEKEKDALQDTIDALQNYRDALADISDAYQKLADQRTTTQLLGENYQTIILNTTPDDWTKLKDKYIEANDEIADNKKQIEAHEEKTKRWQNEKDQWTTLTSTISSQTKKQAAIQQFGADWEQKLNKNRLISFDDFKDDYLTLQEQINDNTALIESYNEKAGYYQNLKDQWTDITDTYEQSTQDQYAAMLLGQNWETEVLSGRTENLENFKNDYIQIQEAITAEAQRAAEEQVKALQLIEENRQKLDAFKETASKTIDENKKNTAAPTYTTAYASGTKNAKRGLSLVGEDGTETIIDNDGSAALVTKPTLIPMEGGETIYNADDTKALLDAYNLEPVDALTLTGTNGETLTFTPDELWRRWQDVITAAPPAAQPTLMPAGLTQPAKYDLTTVHNTTPVIQNINLSLPNVTNNSGVEYIERELKKLPLQALQYANRR